MFIFSSFHTKQDNYGWLINLITYDYLFNRLMLAAVIIAVSSVGMLDFLCMFVFSSFHTNEEQILTTIQENW